MSNYQNIFLDNGQLVIQEITETRHEINTLFGIAKITHWGANGNFRFTHEGEVYKTCLGNVCKQVENEEYYDFSLLSFEGFQPNDWKYSSEGLYWQSVD